MDFRSYVWTLMYKSRSVLRPTTACMPGYKLFSQNFPAPSRPWLHAHMFFAYNNVISVLDPEMEKEAAKEPKADFTRKTGRPSKNKAAAVVVVCRGAA